MKNFLIVSFAVVVVGVIAFVLMNGDTNEKVVNPEADVSSDTVQQEEREEFEAVERSDEGDLPSSEFIQCLADAGMVIYGSATCPYCKDLVDSLGGYDAAASLYVECGEEMDRCNDEMQTNSVPEIQINGDLLQGNRTFENFATKTGCVL